PRGSRGIARRGLESSRLRGRHRRSGDIAAPHQAVDAARDLLRLLVRLRRCDQALPLRQLTQYTVSGMTARRPWAILLPHDAQYPYVPASIRCNAAATACARGSSGANRRLCRASSALISRTCDCVSDLCWCITVLVITHPSKDAGDKKAIAPPGS